MIGADAITDGTQHLLRLAGEENGRLDALENRIILPKFMYGSERIAETGLSEQNRKELSQLSKGSKAEAKAIEAVLHQLDGLSGKRSLDLAKGKTGGAKVAIKVAYNNSEVKAIKNIYEGKGTLKGENQLKESGRPDNYETLRTITNNDLQSSQFINLSNGTIIVNRDGKIMVVNAAGAPAALNMINTKYWSYNGIGYYLGDKGDVDPNGNRNLYVLLPGVVPQKVSVSGEVGFKDASGTAYNVQRGLRTNTFTVTPLEGREGGRRAGVGSDAGVNSALKKLEIRKTKNETLT